jgi:uncharacterized protein YdgA (DUF945 family)
MRRIILAALGVVLALALVLPWFLGGQARASYEAILAGMSEQGLRVVETGYERGWFSSLAQAELVGDPPAGTSEGVRLRISSRVNHGPWSPDAPRLVPAAAIVESRVEARLPGIEPPPLLLTTVIELDGGGTTRVRLPAIERPAGVGESGVRSEEGIGEVRFAPGFASFEGRFELPSLEIDGETGGQVLLRGLRSESAASRGAGGLYVGHGLVTVDSLALPGVPGGIEARGLSVASRSEPREGGLIDLGTELRLDDIQVEGNGYGPVLLALSLTRVPAEALAALQQAARASASDPAAGQAVAAAMAAQLPSLLEHDPRLALDRLEVKTPEGVVEAQVWVRLPGLTPEVLALPGAWLAHLEGAAELAIPKPLLLDLIAAGQRARTLTELRRRDPDIAELPPEMVPQLAAAARDQLAALVRDGWAEEQAGRVATTVKLGDGLLTINGKTLPIGGMGLLMPLPISRASAAE